jgi:hypothetical protein
MEVTFDMSPHGIMAEAAAFDALQDAPMRRRSVRFVRRTSMESIPESEVSRPCLPFLQRRLSMASSEASPIKSYARGSVARSSITTIPDTPVDFGMPDYCSFAAPVSGPSFKRSETSESLWTIPDTPEHDPAPRLYDFCDVMPVMQQIQVPVYCAPFAMQQQAVYQMQQPAMYQMQQPAVYHMQQQTMPVEGLPTCKSCPVMAVSSPKAIEENKKSQKLFIGGLPEDVTAKELRSYFSQFAEVTDSAIVLDKRSKKSRGFGFVDFAFPISNELLAMKHIFQGVEISTRIYGNKTRKETC